MDALDVRILRELIWGLSLSPLSWNLRMSFGDLARKLGADEGTVRNRVRSLHESGFIRGWRTILNPTLLGGREWALWLDAGDAIPKDEVLEAARLLPGVVLINNFHGGGLSIILRYRDEAVEKRTVDLFLRFVHPEWRVLARIPFPPCDLPLSVTDRAILSCLQESPRKSAVVVARELSVATRTVRRRLRRMMDHQAIFAFPSLDPKALKGTLMAGLFVTSPAERTREVDEALAADVDDHLWHVFRMLPFHPDGFHPCFYNLFLPTLARAREVLRRAHDLPGVAHCRLELFEDVETHFEAFDGEFDGPPPGS